MGPTFVDCQGFAGGFTLGAVQAGLELVAKREDGSFGVSSCEVNRHLLGQGWSVDTKGPASWQPLAVDVVLGNPSCGGFSIKSATGRKRGKEAAANDGMWNFVRFAARCRPTTVVFESVQGARVLPYGHELMRQLHDSLEEWTGLEYTLTHVRHSAHTLGGAAIRPRYFWVASRLPFGVDHRSTANVPDLDDVIRDLEFQPLSMSAQPYAQPPTWWSQTKRSPAGTVDGHDLFDSPKVGRLYDLLAGPFQWEEGEYLEQFVRRYEAAGLPLPASQAAVGVGIGQMCRWESWRPARTVLRDTPSTAIHPRLQRFLTWREVARVMGYPDDWLLEPALAGSGGKIPFQHSFGKGVTVECGRWIAHWVRESLAGRPGPLTGVPVGQREYDVDVTEGRDTVQKQQDFSQGDETA